MDKLHRQSNRKLNSHQIKSNPKMFAAPTKTPLQRKPAGLRETILYIQEKEREQLRKENLKKINLAVIDEEDQVEVTAENFIEN